MSDMRGTRIGIEQAKAGMFVIGLDRSWFATPFFFHRFVLTDEHIERLKQHGVREIVIDPAKGLDVETAFTERRGDTEKGRRGDTKVAASPDHPFTESAQEVWREQAPGGRESRTKELETVIAVRAEAARTVQRIFGDLRDAKPLDVPAVTQTVQTLLNHLLDHPSAMMAVVILEKLRRFEDTSFVHAVDICVVSLMIGKACEFDAETLQRLGLGALLHDVGELWLPRNLIRKGGRYTDEETRLMQQHAALGAESILRSMDFPHDAYRAILEHHERLDGSGYPFQLRGEQIASLSRVVGIAERWNALVSGRGRRPPIPAAHTLQTLYQMSRSRQFDRSLVEHLISMLGVYPVGSLVELTTGERGWVIAMNPANRLKPTVQLLWDPGGISKAAPVVEDIPIAEPGGTGRAIARALDPAQEGIDPPLPSSL